MARQLAVNQSRRKPTCRFDSYLYSLKQEARVQLPLGRSNLACSVDSRTLALYESRMKARLDTWRDKTYHVVVFEGIERGLPKTSMCRQHLARGSFARRGVVPPGE
jgi:hypothetical protein